MVDNEQNDKLTVGALIRQLSRFPIETEVIGKNGDLRFTLQLVVSVDGDASRVVVQDDEQEAAAPQSGWGDDQYLSTEQLCEWLNCERDWVYDRKHLIPHAKMGRLLRFRVGDVRAYLARSTQTNG
ncbi:helix-turn-helix domain-containing protein [Kineosporia succinea]|uniref:Excisionase family DNA binding protein n=1 Tax=Kineosporia succinea TaxID=84632 RepID=A0ABT9NXQ4_9ACTN|nr:helix-turn-helix domain-containing protein [Kineosporia succinea]MDP9825190.1 excisionase family DNA binding protein [Kineosporia succinea]